MTLKSAYTQCGSPEDIQYEIAQAKETESTVPCSFNSSSAPSFLSAVTDSGESGFASAALKAVGKLSNAIAIRQLRAQAAFGRERRSGWCFVCSFIDCFYYCAVNAEILNAISFRMPRDKIRKFARHSVSHTGGGCHFNF